MKPKEIAKRLSVDEKLKLVGEPAGFTTREANRVTQSRLQYALSDLAEGNVGNVNEWLRQVGEHHPAEAIRLYMELLEFRMPRMKAAQVIASANFTPGADGSKDLRTMTIDELASALGEN